LCIAGKGGSGKTALTQLITGLYGDFEGITGIVHTTGEFLDPSETKCPTLLDSRSEAFKLQLIHMRELSDSEKSPKNFFPTVNTK